MHFNNQKKRNDWCTPFGTQLLAQEYIFNTF